MTEASDKGPRDSGGGGRKSRSNKRRGGGAGAGHGGAAGAGGGKRTGARPGSREPGRGPGGQRGPGQGGGHAPPLEVAARSTRNAIKRHTESVRDEQSKIACRGVLSGSIAGAGRAASPAELLGLLEQVVHVLHAGAREEAQLPLALRAAVGFARDTPRRQRDVEEMLRLALRYGYVLAADHIPRQLRDDGGFRATAVADALSEVAAEYLDDQRFAQLAR